MVGTFCLTGKEEGDLPGWYAFGCPKDNDSGGIRKKRLGIVWIALSKKHFVKATLGKNEGRTTAAFLAEKAV
jgi:hypothetical protein